MAGTPEPIELLDLLADGEDEFDVDLMACGCRLPIPVPYPVELSMDDVVRLYDLDVPELTLIVGALIDRAKIEPREFYELVDMAVRGELKEEPSELRPLR